MEVELHGYSYSVYTWIVKFTLFEKGVTYRMVEVNPFSKNGHPAHPFGKVPLLIYNGFRIYETNAITRFIDATFPGPKLQSTDTKAQARSDQIISIIDSYAYWPLIRQVFSQGYFNKAFDLDVDLSDLAIGLEAAPQVLAALDDLIVEQGFMKTGQLSLADIHLGPIISYYELVPDAAKSLKGYPSLSNWWNTISKLTGLVESKPQLPHFTGT